MGVIEKAGGIDARLGAAEEAASRPKADGEPRRFDLDFMALAAQGFYAPSDNASRLSLELRSVKRALLRRLGLRNAVGERRMIRKGGRQRNLVLVTSTRAGEGKTFCAMNLALSLACEDEISALLVDGDIQRPKIRAHLGLPETPGLSDRILDPTLTDGETMFRARQVPLAVLSEGAPVDRASELLSSAEAQRLFTGLSMAEAGRLVIIDAPPVLATTEALVLARHVDEVVFIVEADATPEAAVSAALDELVDANPNVSLLLNRCLIGASGAYYGAYERYGRKQSETRTSGRGAAEAGQ